MLLQFVELIGKGAALARAFHVGAKVNQTAVVNQGGAGNTPSIKNESATAVLQTAAMYYLAVDTDIDYFL